jgi:hypothetical protein
MFMQNFSSLACNQTGLDRFLTIFEENLQDFSGKLLGTFKKYQLSSIHPDGLRQIFNLFKEKFEISKSEKSSE